MSSATNQAPSEHVRACEYQEVIAFAPPRNDSAQEQLTGGNACQLCMLQAAPGESPAPASGTTLCQSWPTVHNDMQAIAVSCYTAAGRTIECCGHGLLSAAHCWLERMQCEDLCLLMHDSLIQSWREQATTWLRFVRLPTTPVAMPDWTNEIFPAQQQPVAAAISGAARGYLILQWPDDFMLKALEPSLGQLAGHSARALICTSAQPSVGADAIQLRYFAPQYGVNEDSATGSAMRVLADYWSHRFLTLSAQQCSPTGGFLLSRFGPTHVQVGGRCHIAIIKRTNA